MSLDCYRSNLIYAIPHFNQFETKAGLSKLQTPPFITQTLADSSTTAETIFAIGLTRLFTRQVVRNGNRVRQKFYGPGKCLIPTFLIFWMSIFETLLVIKSNNENLHFLGHLIKKCEKRENKRACRGHMRKKKN